MPRFTGCSFFVLIAVICIRSACQTRFRSERGRGQEVKPILDFRKNSLKVRKLRQDLGRRVLLLSSSRRTQINLLVRLSKVPQLKKEFAGVV